jgi:hypothetical protein
MALACDKCGTTDFAVEGRAFSLGFICPHCRLVMCSACTGLSDDAIPFLCCYHCRSTDLHEASVWADRLTGDAADPPAAGR